jgi:MFS family permease
VPQTDNRYLAGFMAFGILTGTNNGIAKVIMPLVAVSLHAQPWQVGMVGGIQFLGMLLLSLPLGALIDRYGGRTPFRFGAISASLVFFALLSQASAPWQLICGVALTGLLAPFRVVPINTEYLHLLPQMGLTKAGWQRAAHTLGMFFIGPILGALLLGWLGYPDTFRMVAAGMLVTLLIGNRVLAGSATGRGREATPFAERLRGQLQILTARAQLRQSMLIEFCGQTAMSYFNVFIILVAIREFGLSTELAAGLITVQGAVFVLTLLLAAGWPASWQESGRYALAFLLLLAAQLLFAFPLAVPSLWLGAVLLGLGLGIQHVTSVNRFAALTQELGRGRVGGMFSLAGPTGGLTGAMLGGVLSQHFGMQAGFRVLILVYVALLFGLGWRRLRVARSARGAAPPGALGQRG